MQLDVDLLPDAVLVVDPAGVLVSANAAARTLLAADAAVGRGLVDALDVRDPLGEPAFTDGWPTSTSGTECTFGAGGDRPVAVTVTVAVGDDGGAVLVARPVGDASGIAIVSTVSHELRSPLTSVKGYVSLLLNRWDRIDDDKKREMLTQVHHDADRVTRLVTELLDISRLETGRLVLRRQLVDLGGLARTVVEKVGMSYPRLDCSVAVEDGLPEVYADPDKLEQVLTNLVENAAKYGDPVGMAVACSLEPGPDPAAPTVGGEVRVSVTDRGEGIPAEDLPRVFTKFFRRDHGRPTGTGLGLWISRGLVEAHGGELVATSTVGEGATFAFTVPADAFDAIHG